MALRVSDEAHFHTFEQIETYATEAVRLADTLDLTGEDRAALLPKIVELLAAKQVMFEQVGGMASLLSPGRAVQ